MPYINKIERESLDDGDFPVGAGQLNYTITNLCNKYLNTRQKKYADYNEIIGVLESAKLEFYRRAVANYEDQKIKENGDVYSV